jgi:glycosyltransferase involved in cell wall biosynthesis
VFPRVWLGIPRLRSRGTGIVEVWNGIPWLTPLWTKGANVTWIHHVHEPLWDVMCGPFTGAIGRTVEMRMAPRLYRRSLICTPGESTRDILERRLGLGRDSGRISVVPPGVDPAFCPSGLPDPAPSVLVVARLVRSKRVELVIDAMRDVVGRYPVTVLHIVGDGPERARLEHRARATLGPQRAIFHGAVSQQHLIEAYRSAWILVSASAAEGWGMTISEAGACGTPAVATDIAGHQDAVLANVTGLLVPPSELGRGISQLIANHRLRDKMGHAARAKAAELSWERTAWRTADALVQSASGVARMR